jgi:hypothetical protein
MVDAQDPPDEMPWDNTQSPDWHEEVSDWPWNKVGDDWAKSNRCPRCDHGMTVLFVKSGVFDVLERTERDLRSAAVGASCDDTTWFAYCNCSSEHPGRPGDLDKGCGRWSCITRPSS